MTTDVLLQFLLAGITAGSIYALVALGFTIIFNATDIINVAQGEFVMLGGMFAYTFYKFLNLPLPLAIIIAILVVTVVGIVFQVAAIRPAKDARVLNLVMITIGASVLFSSLALIFWGKDPLIYPPLSGEKPILIGGAALQPQSLWIVGTTLGVMVALHLFYKRTVMGQAMLATSINKDAAAAMGINVGLSVMISFALAAALGGLGGILITPMTTAHYEMGLSMTLKGFGAAMLGGLGNSMGALVGGLLLGVLEALGTGFVASGYKDLIAMAILIAVLMFRPGGILGSRAMAGEV